MYGSCVSRDLVRLDPDRFEVSYYLARQSWISAFSKPVAPPRYELASKFQARMVDFDFRSMGKRLIGGDQALASDVILLDLIDERLGVIPLNGTYVTWSGEMRRTGLVSSADLRKWIKFGTDKHFALWSKAAEKVRAALEPAMDRVFVLGAKFAETSIEGETIDGPSGRPIAEWNAMYDRYYAKLEDLGFTVLQQDPESCVSTTEHLWGVAPYHYVDRAYFDFGDAILTHRRAV